MIRRPPRSTRTGHTLSLHDALPIFRIPRNRDLFLRPARSMRIAMYSARWRIARAGRRSEEHTSELQSLMRISYAVFCLKKKKKKLLQNNMTDRYNITLNHNTE